MIKPFKIPLGLIVITLTLFGCNSAIKNENAQILVEEGATPDTLAFEKSENTNEDVEINPADSLPKVYWVGFFEPHEDVDMAGKYISADEGLYWTRRNKISISIDQIIGDSVKGHSVVAGNDRPFSGKIVNSYGMREFVVREPGDNKYDGQFTFQINGKSLSGTWEAYKEIDIPKRRYQLQKRTFEYDPEILLEPKNRYGDWNKFMDTDTITEIFDEGTPDEEEYVWIKREFASATNKVYELNASSTLLKKEDVENLTNSDLVVIRNTIYARHGYSFKHRPLRIFFDEQDWYIPVHADIKQDFTETEKKNIRLLLKYEKNAKEYYDYFGRW